MTYIFGKLFTLSKRIYVIAFAKVSSSMIFQGGGVSKIFWSYPALPVNHELLLAYPSRVWGFIFCKIGTKTTLFSLRSYDGNFYALKRF